VSNAEAVRAIYGAFGRGDVPAILDKLDDAVEWETTVPVSDVPWLQARRGKANIGGFFECMVNYRVEDLHALVMALKTEGCNVLDKIDECEYGKFAWVIDPEGNKVELWQPPVGQ